MTNAGAGPACLVGNGELLALVQNAAVGNSDSPTCGLTLSPMAGGCSPFPAGDHS